SEIRDEPSPRLCYPSTMHVEPRKPHPIENAVERFLFAGRWLLVPLYVGLTLTLLLFTAKFVQELVHVVPMLPAMAEADLILTALALMDLVLVGNLLVMVILSGYESFVSRIEAAKNENLAWLGKLDAGTLKVKVAASIVAISSIHLLKAFMNAQDTPNDKLMWLVIIHLTFVVSALILAWVDKIAFASHREH
ncbi:MAG TPA: TIGR00645 family protein, partial [Candidatus Omnitrophota bacterium]|nr:TIGR00645 family protein [Candidatus Omnitrophota bacterium]